MSITRERDQIYNCISLAARNASCNDSPPAGTGNDVFRVGNVTATAGVGARDSSTATATSGASATATAAKAS
jgi:hypothetical protein